MPSFAMRLASFTLGPCPPRGFMPCATASKNRCCLGVQGGMNSEDRLKLAQLQRLAPIMRSICANALPSAISLGVYSSTRMPNSQAAFIFSRSLVKPSPLVCLPAE